MLKKLRQMFQRARDERGFTLVELLMVMVIIGVLAGLGFTGFNALQQRTAQAQADAYWRDLNTAVQMYRVEQFKSPASLEELTDEKTGFLDGGVAPWNGTVESFQYTLDPVCVKVDGQVAGTDCSDVDGWSDIQTGD